MEYKQIIREKQMKINLSSPSHAYLFGFLQSDGHMHKQRGNRGKVSIEISKRDEHILQEFANIIGEHSNISHRTRDTNFGIMDSALLTICSLDIRNQLEHLGMPYGKKSDTINTPQTEFSERDYFRGIVDGDGSLGITSQGFPFLSLVTASDNLAHAFNDLIFRICGISKKLRRNTRDNIYNICIYKEDAQALVQYLYYDGCLCLSRKLESSKAVLSWIRPDSMKRVKNRTWWTVDQDAFVLSHSFEESAHKLGRSLSSVKNRMFRLRHGLY